MKRLISSGKDTGVAQGRVRQPMQEGLEVRIPKAAWAVKRVLLLGGPASESTAKIQDDGHKVDVVNIRRAVEKLAKESQRYDFIVVDLDEMNMNDVKTVFSESEKLNGIELPRIFGITGNKEHGSLEDPGRQEMVFVCSGVSGIPDTVKMVRKLVEDERRVNDQYSLVVLLVEDQPVLYSELLALLQERYGDKALILLAESYEEAMKVVNTFEPKIIGLVADTHLPKKGRYCERAGILIAEVVKQWDREVPAVIISEDVMKKGEALSIGCQFLQVTRDIGIKLIDFLNMNAGFGKFVFRLPNRLSIYTVDTVPDFFRIIGDIPIDCLMYHACKDHFSTWLYLHGAREIADKLKEIKTAEYFGREEELRGRILKVYEELRHTIIGQKEQ